MNQAAAFNDYFTEIRYEGSPGRVLSVPPYLYAYRTVLRQAIETYGLPVRCMLTLGVKFYRTNPLTGEIEYRTHYFNSHFGTILHAATVPLTIEHFFHELLRSVDSFVKHGSNWRVWLILFMDLKMTRYYPLIGGADGHTFPIPQWIAAKKAIINVKAPKGQCFVYSVLAALYAPSKYAERQFCYRKHWLKTRLTEKYMDPVHVLCIDPFETANRIAINVYSIHKKTIYLLRKAKISSVDKVANILFLPNEADSQDIELKHFVAIRSLS